MKPRLSTTAGAVLVLGLLGAAPAVGVALSGEPGGQPPAGTKPIHVEVTQPGAEAQPPAGAKPIHVEVPQPGAEAQPPNLHPDLEGAPTQLNDDEPNARHYPNQVDLGTATSGPDKGD